MNFDDTPLPRLPLRPAESHKGDYGRALLVGGSRGMAGAIGLAGISALRGGAGLVKLAVPEGIQATVAGYEPSYMTVGLPSDAEGRIALDAAEAILSLAEEANAVALGPGLGRSQDLQELVGQLYQQLRNPMVVDADALNALALQPALLESPGGPRILTPHAGEFTRLVSGEHQAVKDQRAKAAQLAQACGIVLVLKGHHALVTDGTSNTLNTTGNPGLATGGSGDVLTGLITALLCQGLSALDAARLATHLHGLAGDLAAAELGQVSLIASDLPTYLPAAFLELNGKQA